MEVLGLLFGSKIKFVYNFTNNIKVKSAAGEAAGDPPDPYFRLMPI